MSTPAMRLDLPRRVLVTGAAGGIGGAVARRLAAAGVGVIATDLRGEAPDLVAADISTEAGRAAVVAAAGDGIGGIVHAAGIIDPCGWQEIGEAAMARIFAVNVIAPFLLTRVLLPKMDAGGSIVVLGSIAARRAAPDTAAYAASKAALGNLAATLAQALAGSGIRVNTLAPGLIDTGLTRGLDHRLATARHSTPAEVAAARAAAVPVGRAGSPDEVADACLYLLSRQAGYVDGATLFATGAALAGAI